MATDNSDPAQPAADAQPHVARLGRGLIASLEANQDSAKYLFATLSSQTAAPYIIATGKPVMALGGFSGSDQILTLSQLKTVIREGQVKYFLLSGGGFGGPGGGGVGNSQLVRWVEVNCARVSASAYGGSSAGWQLYACTSAVLGAANS
jgi:4-amino-4-deoxy-L-arabinose transferase-like glycosyltransferase